MEGEIDEEQARPRGRHINKRALKNKALAVSFDEKDLRDYVTGFHKRKKKRRKEAHKQQEETHRRKRIEARKKRKLEREMVYGGAPPATGSEPDGGDECQNEDEDNELVESISGTTTYDNGNMKVTVTTSEISHEEDIFPSETQAGATQSIGAVKKFNVPVSKKKQAFKRIAKPRSRPKAQKKREKRKGKTTIKKMR